MGKTYASAIERYIAMQTVAFHIWNDRDMYAIIADNVKDAQNDSYAFATLIAEFTLYMREYDGFANFPAWARGDYSIVAEAVTNIVETWED